MQVDPKNVQLHPAGYLSQEWQTRLPAGVRYAALFSPDTWREVERIMRTRKGKCPVPNDLLRVIAADGAFDVTCTIIAVGDGYGLEFRHGRRPSPVAHVLDDLDALPDTASTADLKKQANTLRKRWAAAGVTREDLSSARRAFAKTAHPDTNRGAGHRLAAANAVLDAALEVA